jgi:outer membrane protein assembly factor BamD (BamD/ComL family)
VARGSVWLFASALIGAAPYQCKSNDPERAREETPGEALWLLCGRFAQRGDAAAARRTLEYLIERYPSSREARRARTELEADRPCAEILAAPSASAP